MRSGRSSSRPSTLQTCFAREYVERNPLRAGLVASAKGWPHGSLGQLRRRGAARLLDPWPFPGPAGWAEAVDRPETPQELEALRRSVQRGTPFGSSGWVTAMADRYGLASSLRPRGRPPWAEPPAASKP